MSAEWDTDWDTDWEIFASEPGHRWADAITSAFAGTLVIAFLSLFLLGGIAVFRKFVLDVPGLPDSVAFYLVLHGLIPLLYGMYCGWASWEKEPREARRWIEQVVVLYEGEIRRHMDKGRTREQAAFLIKGSRPNLYYAAQRVTTDSSDLGKDVAELKKAGADAGRLSNSPDDELERMIRAAEGAGRTEVTPDAA